MSSKAAEKKTALQKKTALAFEPGAVAPATPAPWHTVENLLLTFFFAVMLLLPLIDILGRKFHQLLAFIPANPVSGSLNLVAHSTLAVMMVGGAIAAREGKLLSLSTTASLIPERFKIAVRVFTCGLGAAITLYLAKASFDYMLIEKGVDSIIACGIPKWAFLALLPLGFSAILARLIWRVSEENVLRLGTLLLAVCLSTLGVLIQHPSESFLYVCFAVLMVSVIFGAPVFVALGGAALIF
jgi:C4-dicarboxylate transporter DctM subunit